MRVSKEWFAFAMGELRAGFPEMYQNDPKAWKLTQASFYKRCVTQGGYSQEILERAFRRAGDRAKFPTRGEFLAIVRAVAKTPRPAPYIPPERQLVEDSEYSGMSPDQVRKMCREKLGISVP